MSSFFRFSFTRTTKTACDHRKWKRPRQPFSLNKSKKLNHWNSKLRIAFACRRSWNHIASCHSSRIRSHVLNSIEHRDHYTCTFFQFFFSLKRRNVDKLQKRHRQTSTQHTHTRVRVQKGTTYKRDEEEGEEEEEKSGEENFENKIYKITLKSLACCHPPFACDSCQ